MPNYGSRSLTYKYLYFFAMHYVCFRFTLLIYQIERVFSTFYCCTLEMLSAFRVMGILSDGVVVLEKFKSGDIVSRFVVVYGSLKKNCDAFYVRLHILKRNSVHSNSVAS